MSNELPIPSAFKVTPKAVYVGEPAQLVSLLASGVATAVLEVTRTKGQIPLYKPKLRCKTLFEGNVDVYFHLDWPNQVLEPKQDAASGELSLEVALLGESRADVAGITDKVRAQRFADNLQLALSYWATKMEDSVRSSYPDRTPVQIDRLQKEDVLELRINAFVKNFDLPQFLSSCVARKGIPCFRVVYGWISSKEDPRSTEQPWGFKMELSPYAQFPPVPRSRKQVSAVERQEQLLKKRKQSDEASEAVESVVSSV